jgi:hypothetical protein
MRIEPANRLDRSPGINILAPSAGSYRAAVPLDGWRPGHLTLRVLLGDTRIEMPVGD